LSEFIADSAPGEVELPSTIPARNRGVNNHPRRILVSERAGASRLAGYLLAIGRQLRQTTET
jgi:hypothetical protein